MGNDPVNNIDPDGKFKKKWLLIGAVVIVSGLAIYATGGLASYAAPYVISSLGISEGTAAAIGTSVAIVGTHQAAQDLTKSVVGLATDVNPDTGKPYTDDEGNIAMGMLPAQAFECFQARVG